MRPSSLTRRSFLKKSAWAVLAAACAAPRATLRASLDSSASERFFLTRGVVLVPNDLKGLDWPALAQQAGLTTLAMHGAAGPPEFPRACRAHGLQVEYEMHALSSLLPRSLFAQDPTCSVWTRTGSANWQHNCCVHSEKAVRIVCQNALKWAKDMRPTTGRYFFWTDDGQVMCRCEQCREFSDSDPGAAAERTRC